LEVELHGVAFPDPDEAAGHRATESPELVSDAIGKAHFRSTISRATTTLAGPFRAIGGGPLGGPGSFACSTGSGASDTVLPVVHPLKRSARAIPPASCFSTVCDVNPDFMADPHFGYRALRRGLD